MTNLTTAQIARLTAEITGDAPRGSATKDAAIKRFRDARAENIIGAASFEEAIDFLRIALDAKPEAPNGDQLPVIDTSDLAEAAAALEAEDKAAEEADRIAEKMVAAKRLHDAAATSRRAALRAIEAASPAPAEKPKREAKAKADKALGKRAAILAAAEAGELPAAPDFSAETHKRFRGKLAEVIALVEAGDIAGLEAYQINPVSSSPKAIAKYRDLAVIALKARAAKGKAA
jgi:hypothetical protein